MNHCFRNRKREEKGKGGYWELGMDPKKSERKRIRNRKTSQRKLDSTKKMAKFGYEKNTLQILHRKHSDQNQSDDKVFFKANENHALTMLDIETDPGVTLSNVVTAPTDINLCHPSDEQAQGNMELLHPLQQQFEMGTIIISTTGIIDESTCLNSIITNKFSCTNMVRSPIFLIISVKSNSFSYISFRSIVMMRYRYQAKM